MLLLVFGIQFLVYLPKRFCYQLHRIRLVAAASGNEDEPQHERVLVLALVDLDFLSDSSGSCRKHGGGHELSRTVVDVAHSVNISLNRSRKSVDRQLDTAVQ